MPYACNLALRKLRQEDPEFKASLNYTMRPRLKQKVTWKEWKRILCTWHYPLVLLNERLLANDSQRENKCQFLTQFPDWLLITLKFYNPGVWVAHLIAIYDLSVCSISNNGSLWKRESGWKIAGLLHRLQIDVWLVGATSAGESKADGLSRMQARHSSSLLRVKVLPAKLAFIFVWSLTDCLIKTGCFWILIKVPVNVQIRV